MVAPICCTHALNMFFGMIALGGCRKFFLPVSIAQHTHALNYLSPRTRKSGFEMCSREKNVVCQVINLFSSFVYTCERVFFATPIPGLPSNAAKKRKRGFVLESSQNSSGFF